MKVCNHSQTAQLWALTNDSECPLCLIDKIERLRGFLATESKAREGREAILRENERLRGLLREAADDIEHWGGYVSEYFKDKCHLDDDIKKYREAALAGEPATEPAKTAVQPDGATEVKR